MTWPDMVNGLYELCGGFFVLLHCIKLCRDKQVQGVSVVATIFFATWGGWNLYYYPHRGQWASFAGGCNIVTMNILWIGLMWYYIKREKRRIQ